MARLEVVVRIFTVIVIMFKAIQITQIPTPWVGKSGWSVSLTIYL
jgi:hypothetical protein